MQKVFKPEKCGDCGTVYTTFSCPECNTTRPEREAKAKKKVTVVMTRERALSLGIVRCKSCGYPPNNHFNFGAKKCAHDSTCTGYKEEIG